MYGKNNPTYGNPPAYGQDFNQPPNYAINQAATNLGTAGGIIVVG